MPSQASTLGSSAHAREFLVAFPRHIAASSRHLHWEECDVIPVSVCSESAGLFELNLRSLSASRHRLKKSHVDRSLRTSTSKGF